MKMPFTDPLPRRQKNLWIETFVDLLVLAVYVANRCFWPASRDPAVIFLTLSILLPNIYNIANLYPLHSGFLDERDTIVKRRGRDAGYVLMTAGIWFIMSFAGLIHLPFRAALLVLWLCSRILTHSVQLRIYAGHEAWWPDNLIAAFDRRKEQYEQYKQSKGERTRP